MTQHMNIAADFDLTLLPVDLETIVWARNITALALNLGLKQNRCQYATVSIMLQIVDRVVKHLEGDAPLDKALLRGFVQAGWGLLDLTEHWLTFPALLSAAKAEGLVTPDAAYRVRLTDRLGRTVDELKRPAVGLKA